MYNIVEIHTLKIKKQWIFSVLVAMVSVYIYILPSPIEPRPFFYSQPPVLQGSLKPNNYLQKCKRLHEGKLVGPESFAVDQNGTLYTGTADGKILAFTDSELRVLTRTGPDLPGCGSFEMEPVCGRPKGMKVDKDGFLIVLDSSKGMLKVNTKTGGIQTLIPTSTETGPYRFLNSLDITDDGLIYFTDSTRKWDRRNYRYEVLEINNSGRLLVYNPADGKTRVLLDDLYLPNGLALSQDQSFLVIAEMTPCHIRKYYLRGPKTGQSEIILDNLPGYPDNLKLNSRGNFYAGLGSVRFEGVSLIGPFLDLVGPYPTIKNILTKIIPLALFDIFLPKHAMIVEFDKNGKILSSLHDPTASVIRFAGEGFEYKNSLYIGSFKNPYIGKLDLDDIRDTNDG